MSLMQNGFALGLKKTIGKITQPINMYTRFPEYDIFQRAIEKHLSGSAGQGSLRILDIGSPKLFGLSLSCKLESFVYLTDINRTNIDEYVLLWNAVQAKATGQAIFAQMDGRDLPHANDQFDIVYAMSVLEHIEGEQNDSIVLQELLRVLKPAGLILISVPLGETYVEQAVDERLTTHKQFASGATHFFQRIYDRSTVTANLLRHLAGRTDEMVIQTVYRDKRLLTLLYHGFRKLVGTDVIGLLGFTNPCLSRLINRRHEGFRSGHLGRYSLKHRLSDIYSDLLVIAKKRA